MTSDFVYRFTPAKRLDAKTTRMATVDVIELRLTRVIGTYSWSRPKPSQVDIDYMVREIIREYGQSKAFNKRGVARHEYYRANQE